MLTLLSVAVAAVVPACGSAEGNPYGLSDFSGTSTPALRATPGPAPSASAGSSPAGPGARRTVGPVMQVRKAPAGALTYHPADVFAEGAWVERGTIMAVAPARKAVVDAAVAFMTVRVHLSNTWQIDEPALLAVASGQALQNMRDRAEVQRVAERRSVGPFVLNLASVSVDGDRAVVSGCSFDGTAEVSTQGSVMSDPPGGIELSMNLQRHSDQWRVTTFPAQKSYCTAPVR